MGSEAERANRCLVVGAAIAGLALCLAYLVSSPFVPLQTDEIFHVLAGRSWSEHGTLRILDGEYRRAALLTKTIGLIYRLTGSDSLFVARCVPIAATAILMTSMVLWIGRRAGLVAAGAAALLMLFNSQMMLASVFARFYSPQALLVWLASIAVFASLEARSRRRVAWLALGALTALAISFRLQVTTIVAAGAIGLWVAIEAWFAGWLTDLLRKPLVRLLLLPGLIVLAAAAAWVIGQFGGRFFEAPLWAQSNADDYLFFLRTWMTAMPLLVVGFPVAFLLAWQINPRVARFGLVMTLVPLAAQSLGAMKSSRYVCYVLPYFLLVWAFACARADKFLRRRLSDSGIVSSATIVLLALGAFLVFAQGGYRRTALLYLHAGGSTLLHPSKFAQPIVDRPWTEHAAALAALARNAPLVVNNDDLRGLYHLGRHDILINLARIDEIIPPHEFSRDFRTGRPVVGSPGAVDGMLRCLPGGLIVVTNTSWRNPLYVTAPVADGIEQSAVPVTPGIAGFRLFRWQGSGQGADCPAVRRALGSGR